MGLLYCLYLGVSRNEGPRNTPKWYTVCNTECLDSQVAGNNRPLYAKVDHYWLKIAHNYEPLASFHNFGYTSNAFQSIAELPGSV